MTSSWPCPLCKRNIIGQRARASHYRNLWKKRDDPNRCDNRAFAVPIISSQVIADCATDNCATASTSASCAPTAALVQQPTSLHSLYHLARRPFKDIYTARDERNQYTITDAPLHARSGTYNMLKTQNAWDRYLSM